MRQKLAKRLRGIAKAAIKADPSKTMDTLYTVQRFQRQLPLQVILNNIKNGDKDAPTTYEVTSVQVSKDSMRSLYQRVKRAVKAKQAVPA